MKTNSTTRSLEFLIVLILLLCARPAQANFHLWDVNEIYSNADGSVQFIELTCSSGGQEVLAGHIITCSSSLGTRTFTLTTNVPSGTAAKTLIIGTRNLASIPGGVTPNYVLTNVGGFLFPSGAGTVTVSLVGADTVTYTNLPTDGVRSLFRSGSSTVFGTPGTNSPKNYAGQASSIVPVKFNTAGLSGGDFLLSFATANGPNYAIEAVGHVNSNNWTVVSNVTGNGTVKNIALPIATQSNRFFRLRVP